MTEFQKRVYNTHLRVSRQIKGLPYRLRLDFSNFENDVNFVALNKICLFFNNHKSVNVELFFKAPYEIYGKNETFYLDFYLSSKAHKAYTLLLNRIKDSDPDNSEQLQFIVQSAKFVQEFCAEQNIPIQKYLEHTPASTPSFIQHLLQCNVSIYFLFAWRDFETMLQSFDWELTKFILGEDFFSKLEGYRLNYYRSIKAKILANKALEKICTLSRDFSAPSV
jgi:hypothetical protein